MRRGLNSITVATCANTHIDTHAHRANKRVGSQNDSLERRIGKKFRNQPPMAPCGDGAAYGVCECVGDALCYLEITTKLSFKNPKRPEVLTYSNELNVFA